ncbi:MAG: cytochrome C [Desulfuromonadales bacterium]|nr:MAG: cytochrome C [Desulfuromonadales bacterium]
MKKGIMATVCMVALAAFATAGFADTKKGEKIDGAKEFQEHCASCHADGGNIVNPKKTLKKADMEANGVKSWKDIVKLMRNPGPGMNKFEKKDVSDKEAKAIAEYILKTFK